VCIVCAYLQYCGDVEGKTVGLADVGDVGDMGVGVGVGVGLVRRCNIWHRKGMGIWVWV
jgi:hypothetical protein